MIRHATAPIGLKHSVDLVPQPLPHDLLARSLPWSDRQCLEPLSFIYPPVTESFSSSRPAHSLLFLWWEQLRNIHFRGADALQFCNIMPEDT